MALHEAAARLASVSASAALDSEVLLGCVLDKRRGHLRAWPQRLLTEDQARHFAALVARRQAGEPVAYITGRREFWSLQLTVTPATLIPRPETELVVEQVLAHITADATLHIADLGTGSGAIALAVAHARPHCRVIATDISDAALQVARENARRLGATNVEFRGGDWFQPLNGQRVQVLCCNPPYLRRDDPHLAGGDLSHEPATALVAGVNGLEAIHVVVQDAATHLEAGGRLIMEHGYDQGEAVRECFAAHGFEDIRGHHDLAGHQRVISARVR
jgi:release factor glutamine methyltransferase